MPRAAVVRTPTTVLASVPTGTMAASAAAAVGPPSRGAGARIGTATPSASSCTCPGRYAYPCRRTSARAARSAAWSVIVLAVYRRSGSARIRSCRSRPPNASSTRPEEDACSGSRPAIRV